MSELQEPQKKSSGGLVAIIILLLLSLGAMSYLWSSKKSQLNECENDNKILNSDIRGMDEMMSGYVGGVTNDIKTDFKKMLSTYDALLGKDASQADSINKQKAEIESLLAKVERGNMSARQLFSAHKISFYKVLIDLLIGHKSILVLSDLQNTKKEKVAIPDWILNSDLEIWGEITSKSQEWVLHEIE